MQDNLYFYLGSAAIISGCILLSWSHGWQTGLGAGLISFTIWK